MNKINSWTAQSSSARVDEGVKQKKETGSTDKLTSYEQKMTEPLEPLLKSKTKD